MPPLKLTTDESFGERLSRIRKEKGLTQVELAQQIGIIQSIIADYERDRVRMNSEVICRFAQKLEVSADELLGLKKLTTAQMGVPLRLKFVKRIQKLDLLPLHKQKVLLQTIDGFLRGEGITV